jgi:hypothetical protein
MGFLHWICRPVRSLAAACWLGGGSRGCHPLGRVAICAADQSASDWGGLTITDHHRAMLASHRMYARMDGLSGWHLGAFLPQAQCARARLRAVRSGTGAERRRDPIFGWGSFNSNCRRDVDAASPIYRAQSESPVTSCVKRGPSSLPIHAQQRRAGVRGNPSFKIVRFCV